MGTSNYKDGKTTVSLMTSRHARTERQISKKDFFGVRGEIRFGYGVNGYMCYTTYYMP